MKQMIKLHLVILLFYGLVIFLVLNHFRYFDKPYDGRSIWPDCAIELKLPAYKVNKWKVRNRDLKLKLKQRKGD